ncbi:MAG TPA: serine/threonine-protein kinase [Kofleriaceae bacterium]|jgi:serine/threonine protein kinase
MPFSTATAHIGPYGIIATLGRGGSAGVYLAEHCTTRERVALKVIDRFYADHDDMVARLFAEREVSRRARHAGLIAVSDAGYSDGGAPYIVMEYLDGHSLEQVTDRTDLEMPQIIQIGCEVATAVAALHAAGVVHCDLKPENIFLTETGIKVIDYGISRLLDEPGDRRGMVAGTPAFMAPEQWYGNPEPASDVYSLGCLVFELVTREPLFSGSVPEMMQQHCERRPDRPSTRRRGIPDSLERLIVRMLAKDPLLRPSMNEVVQELELEVDLRRWLDTSPILAVG